MESSIKQELGPSRFHGARFATHSDLFTPQWREAFDDMERYSDRYLDLTRRSGCWPTDYPWPLDSLHCNTRIWEYPFVLDAIQRFAPSGGRVLDIGSALTFLPSYLALKGYDVLASDIDPRMPRWFEAIASRVHSELSWPANKLAYQCLDVTALDARSGTFDYVTNVSVLEHLPMSILAKAICAIRGVLRSGGVFICTLDCWISGPRTEHHHPLDQHEFTAFTEVLLQEFELIEGPEICVPNDLITNERYPHMITDRGVAPKGIGPVGRMERYLRRVASAVLGREKHPRLEWCVFGMTLQNR